MPPTFSAGQRVHVTGHSELFGEHYEYVRDLAPLEVLGDMGPFIGSWALVADEHSNIAIPRAYLAPLTGKCMCPVCDR